MKRILVTGFNGFIGQNIYRELIKLNYFVRGAIRSLDSLLINNKNNITMSHNEYRSLSSVRGRATK